MKEEKVTVELEMDVEVLEDQDSLWTRRANS